MEEIARRLGVTKPALYQYFSGKEDLYAAVTEKCRQELTGLLERSYRNGISQKGVPPSSKLAEYVPRFNDMYPETLLLASHNEKLRDLPGRIAKKISASSNSSSSGNRKRGWSPGHGIPGPSPSPATP